MRDTILNMPTPIVVTGVLYLLVGLLMLVLNFLLIRERVAFIWNYTFNLYIYIFEIVVMYLLYQWVSDYYWSSSTSKEDTPLKQFVDFFAAYQILLFVVLKLYDSLQKDAYCSLIQLIEVAEPCLDTNEEVGSIVLSHQQFSQKDSSIPRQIREYFKKFFSNLNEYNSCLKDIANQETEIKELKTVINTPNVLSPNYDKVSLLISLKEAEKILVVDKENLETLKRNIKQLKAVANSGKEQTDFHWNVSLLLRLIKSLPLSKKQAPDNQ